MTRITNWHTSPSRRSTTWSSGRISKLQARVHTSARLHGQHIRERTWFSHLPFLSLPIAFFPVWSRCLYLPFFSRSFFWMWELRCEQRCAKTLFWFLRFNLFHQSIYGDSPESAKIRYGAEIKRVAGVLDSVLTNRDWLVGDKCTYADLAFVMWNTQIAFVMASRTAEHAWNPDEFPNFTRWQNTMLARDSVKKVLSVLMAQEVKSSWDPKRKLLTYQVKIIT